MVVWILLWHNLHYVRVEKNFCRLRDRVTHSVAYGGEGVAERSCRSAAASSAFGVKPLCICPLCIVFFAECELKTNSFASEVEWMPACWCRRLWRLHVKVEPLRVVFVAKGGRAALNVEMATRRIRLEYRVQHMPSLVKQEIIHDWCARHQNVSCFGDVCCFVRHGHAARF